MDDRMKSIRKHILTAHGGKRDPNCEFCADNVLYIKARR